MGISSVEAFVGSTVGALVGNAVCSVVGAVLREGCLVIRVTELVRSPVGSVVGAAVVGGLVEAELGELTGEEDIPPSAHPVFN